jgi:2,3-dihydroxybiphenyl 1,2-dioxygenase
MSPLRLGYLGIGTPDPGEWGPFADQVLGGTLDEGTAGGPARLILGGHQPAVFLEHAPEVDVRYLGWEVQDAAAFDAAVHRLNGLGIEVGAGSPDLLKQRSVDGIFAFDDPFAYRHEVYYGPHRHLTRRRSGEMEFPELGHAFLLVPDPQEAERFYCAALGLSVSDHISFTMGATPFEPGPVPVDVSFLFASRRHHVLAVAGLPEDLPSRGLAHLMIEAESLDDVGRAYDACLDRDLLVTTIGRHTNDEVISFYLSAPDGVVIEYGWGGKLLTDGVRSIPRYDAPSLWGHRPAASGKPS